MGMHLLQKMGWTPGRGLGKEGTGTLQPLMLEVKLDTRGLQAKEEVSGNNRYVSSHRSFFSSLFKGHGRYRNWLMPVLNIIFITVIV